MDGRTTDTEITDMQTITRKGLAEVFGVRAADAAAILKMSRQELAALPAGAQRIRECYHPPTTRDLRLTCLDAICDGTFGVEAFELTRGRYRGSYCEYLNTGETYATTLIVVAGNYRIGCWGDVAERYT